MKPQYIFGAVIAICILMLAVLPQLASAPHPVQAVNATAAQAASSAHAASSANAAGANVAGAAGAGSASRAATAAPAVQGVSTIAAAPTIPPFTAPLTQAGGKPGAAANAAAPAAVATKTAAPKAAGANTVPSPADANAPAGAGAAAIPATSGTPDLASFVASVSNGQAGLVTGVYVPDKFAMQVDQQPGGDINYVSTADQTVTEYARSAAYGVIGLLAHNTLPSGKEFYQLKPGQDVVLVYGDGRQAHYKVASVEYYQALSPTDPYSDFINLNGPGGSLVRNQDLFQHIYENTGTVVFQTCFEANGDPSWGRMFVIANPA